MVSCLILPQVVLQLFSTFGVAEVKRTDSGKSHYIVRFSRGVHNR